MTDITYEIYYYNGLKPGFDEEQVIQQLASLLKITEQIAEKLVSAIDRVIKGGLTLEQAEKYVYALNRLGMQVEMRPQQQETELALAASQPEDSKEAQAGSVQEEVQVEAAYEEVQVEAVHEEAVEVVQTQSLSGIRRDVAVEFHGSGMEYFKIWIVNIFLTILTLGIYSAWAKVRNKQYFYGNTIIDGSSFQYTASPVTILKGRLIAAAVFIVYSLVIQFVPVIGLLFMLAFIALIPWLVVRSLAFNARNSMYRNIRFNFTGKTMDALKVFVLWPILTPFTLGFIVPLTWYKQNNFIVSNSSYGTTPFSFSATIGSYYRIFFIMLGSIVGASVVIGILGAIIGGEVMKFIFPLLAIGYAALIAYMITALANLYFNSTQLAQHGFTSSLQLTEVAWIYFTNMLAIMASFGLLIPWAQVRMARYRAECLTMQVENSLDDFVAAEQQNVSALGEEMGDVFDVGVSFI
jgi:uncharacterized membrane protein YjgN (DUF898 family)